MGSSSVLARAGAGSSFEVSFIDEIGVRRHEPLPLCSNLPFERAAPSRSFPAFRGQKNFPGLWWSATTGEHVGYEVAGRAGRRHWEFRRIGGPSAVLAANVRWLAGYRHPRCCRPDIADALTDRF